MQTACHSEVHSGHSELFCKTSLKGEQYILPLTFTLSVEKEGIAPLLSFSSFSPSLYYPPSALIWVDGVAVA